MTRDTAPGEAPTDDNAMRERVNLHIEELVVHGFSGRDAADVANAVRQELTRLLGEQGVPGGLLRVTEIGAIDAGRFNAARPTRPESVGAAAAQAIYHGLNGAEGR